MFMCFDVGLFWFVVIGCCDFFEFEFVVYFVFVVVWVFDGDCIDCVFFEVCFGVCVDFYWLFVFEELVFKDVVFVLYKCCSEMFCCCWGSGFVSFGFWGFFWVVYKFFLLFEILGFSLLDF